MLKWPTILPQAARLILPPFVVALIGATALSHPNAAWQSVGLLAAIVAPPAMFVAALYGSAARRPARTGFAIASGVYFLFFMFPSEYMEYLPTSMALDVCYKKLFPTSQANPLPSKRYPPGVPYGGGAFDVPAKDDNSSGQNAAGDAPSADSPNSSAPTAVAAPVTSSQLMADEVASAGNFWIIGHSLWTLIIGWLGGCFAQFLAWRQRRQRGNANLH